MMKTIVSALLASVCGLLLLCLPLGATAQHTVTIKGKVTDEYDKPVSFALILVDGQPAYGMSDTKGLYHVYCQSRDSLTLICSLVGYRTRKFKIVAPQDSTVLNMKIVSSATSLGEVKVSAIRRQTDQMQRIDSKHTRLMPSTTGNAVEELVSTQMGVSTHSEISSQYNVRGGSYDENCVYLNGVEVYRPLLIRSGQQEGLSVINPNMVQDINFSAGGFPARYGDRMSSVLDIQYKRPEHFEASVGASLLGADAYLGVGNKKFSMMNGLRYKTTRYLLGSMDTHGEYKPNFVDYQNFTSWRPTDRLSIEFIGNISENHYNFRPEDRETKFGTQEDARTFRVYFDGKERDLFRTLFGSLNLSYRFGKRTTLSWISSAYTTKEQETYDISGQYWLNETASQSQLGVGTYMEHARNFLHANVLHTGLALRTQVGSHQIQSGIGFTAQTVKENSVEWEKRDSSGYNIPHFQDRFQMVYQLRAKTDIDTKRWEMYLQDTYKWTTKSGRYTLNYGLRASHWDWNDEWLVSPRVSLAMIPSWNEDFTFRIAGGLYYQAPFYKELRDTTTVGGNTSVSLNHDIKSQQSVQIIIGGDYQFRMLNRPFRFSSEIYYKNLRHLIPYNIDNMRIVYYGGNIGTGYTAGIDFKLFGEFVPGTDSWITLGFMTAKQRLHGQTISLPTDQRYNINLYFTDYFPGTDRWTLTLKGSLADGLPFGPPHSGLAQTQFRAPAYRRVDIGLSYCLYRRPVSGRHKASPYGLKNAWLGLDCFNVLGINNVNSYYWVTDVNNYQYAVPNYLTGRMLNLRFLLEF